MVEIEGSAMLPPEVHLVFYRIAQAALGNVVRHAPGRAGAGAAGPRAMPPRRWSIATTGAASSPRRSGERRGMGIEIMRERAEAIGADLMIDSVVGQGTTVTLRWPA